MGEGESVCRAQGSHARCRLVRGLSWAPSERGLGMRRGVVIIDPGFARMVSLDPEKQVGKPHAKLLLNEVSVIIQAFDEAL